MVDAKLLRLLRFLLVRLGGEAAVDARVYGTAGGGGGGCLALTGGGGGRGLGLGARHHQGGRGHLGSHHGGGHGGGDGGGGG